MRVVGQTLVGAMAVRTAQRQKTNMKLGLVYPLASSMNLSVLKDLVSPVTRVARRAV
jgi:hypothetical protein